MDLREVFQPMAIAAYYNEVASNRIPYLGRGLFTPAKRAGLDLSFYKGSKGLPVSLMPSAFDAKATFRDRIGFERLDTEMPFFREGYKIKEKDRQELLRIQDSEDPYAVSLISRIFDDSADLIAAADVVPERMIMQLLFPVDGNVGISIKANGVDYTYNFDSDGSWKTSNYIVLTGADTWDSEDTADPFMVFEKAKTTIRTKTGSELTTAIMNTNTFNKLSSLKAVKDRFVTSNGMAVGYITGNDARSVIGSTSGINIIVYDKLYKDEDKVSHPFVPDDYVCMIPSGTLGNTWYGTTPEEADLMGSSANAEVSIVNTGVAITRIIEEHPVNTNIFASEIVLPSYERMDEVVTIKVV